MTENIPVKDSIEKSNENQSSMLIDFDVMPNNIEQIPTYNPTQENYICKVEPNDFDLLLDCVDEIIQPSVPIENGNQIDNQINKPSAMIAVELASEIEIKRNIVYTSDSSVLLPILIENTNVNNNLSNDTVKNTNKLINITDYDDVNNTNTNNNDDFIDTDSDSKSDTPIPDLPGKYKVDYQLILFIGRRILELNVLSLGSIAEREHLKWKNAQAIPNNPYSAEALKRRLSQPSSLYNNKIDVNPMVATNFNANLEPKGLSPEISDRDHIRYYK